VGTLGSLAAWFFKALLAPLYSMGLFHASKKRLIVSWSMVVGIGAIGECHGGREGERV